MRDVIAAVVAIVLLLVAASLATRLQTFRRGRERARDSERALGRTIVAEIPAADDLRLFSEDAARFYYGDQSIDKDLIVAVRVLINGAPIAAYVSQRHEVDMARQATSFEDRPDGIARDRWDVAIELIKGTVLVECGAIRERVSQELARASRLDPALDGEVVHLQRDLFALGAQLADPADKLAPRVTKAVLGDDEVARLEQLIDRLDAELPPLRRFILAGGTPAGAALHVARTVCRRAERRIVALEPPIDPVLLRYINRLSDLLFVLARVANHRGGVAETEW